MNASQKFLFETSFDPDAISTAAKAKAEEEAAIEEPPAPTFSEEELAAAKAAAFAEGETAGMAAAEEGIARQTAELLSLLDTRIESLSANLDDRMSQNHHETLLAAMTVVRKLFPQINDERGLSEMKAVVEECLERLRDEPRMVIRAADQQIETIKVQLDASIKRSGFSGKLVFLADDRLEPGDIRVEWADGGAERDQSALWQEIDEIIERTLGAALAAQGEAGRDPAEGKAPGSLENGTAQPAPSAEVEPLRRAQSA